MVDQQAKPCPLCGAGEDEAFGNVTRIWTREAFGTHCRDRHPGMDPVTLWKFPAQPASVRA